MKMQISVSQIKTMWLLPDYTNIRESVALVTNYIEIMLLRILH